MSRPSALKKFRRIRRPLPTKHIELPPEEAATSEAIDDVESTMSPHSSNRNRRNGLVGDATVAPAIGEEEKQEYATTYPELIDKHFFSRKQIPYTVIISIVMVFLGLVIYQDNGAGRITTWGEMGWTFLKCIIFLSLFVLCLVTIIKVGYKKQ